MRRAAGTQTQSYLVGIDYLDYEPIGAAADKFLVGVEFDYGRLDDAGEVAARWDYRGETLSIYVSLRLRGAYRPALPPDPGAASRDGCGAPVVRAYEYGYQRSTHSGVSLLETITHVGYAPREPAGT